MTGNEERPHGPAGGVKDAPPRDATSRGRPVLSRQLDGWQAGLVVVTLAGLSALLVVPRPVVPDALPMPHVDRRAQELGAGERRQLAAAARRVPLPFDVRAAGEAFRQLGRVASGTVSGDLDAARRDLVEKVATARAAHGAEPLLQLRAAQTELFLAAVQGGAITPDLLELGGDFARGMHGSAPGTVPRPLPDVASAFTVRWSLLTDVADDPALAPPLNDWRAMFRLRLRYPRRVDPRDRTLEQLETLRALEQKDPEYPSALARGVLAYWLGDYATSAGALRVFLEQRTSGPWQLRARNYLAAANELAIASP